MRKLVTAVGVTVALAALPQMTPAQTDATNPNHQRQYQSDQRQTQAIIDLNPKPGQNPMVGFQDGNGYIWQTPRPGQPKPTGPSGYQDNSGDILIFPNQNSSR
jgi:hypothetical protein